MGARSGTPGSGRGLPSAVEAVGSAEGGADAFVAAAGAGPSWFPWPEQAAPTAADSAPSRTAVMVAARISSINTWYSAGHDAVPEPGASGYATDESRRL